LKKGPDLDKKRRSLSRKERRFFHEKNALLSYQGFTFLLHIFEYVYIHTYMEAYVYGSIEVGIH